MCRKKKRRNIYTHTSKAVKCGRAQQDNTEQGRYHCMISIISISTRPWDTTSNVILLSGHTKSTPSSTRGRSSGGYQASLVKETKSVFIVSLLVRPGNDITTKGFVPHTLEDFPAGTVATNLGIVHYCFHLLRGVRAGIPETATLGSNQSTTKQNPKKDVVATVREVLWLAGYLSGTVSLIHGATGGVTEPCVGRSVLKAVNKK